jgi:hypothetical protein
MSEAKEMNEFWKAIAGAAAKGTKITGVGPGGMTVDIGTDGSTTTTGGTDLTDLFAEGPVLSEVEQALVIAVNALREIQVYVECGRIAPCGYEASDALDAIAAFDIECTKVKEVDHNAPVEEMKIRIYTDKKDEDNGDETK